MERPVHPCFYLIFWIFWPNAQTPCTTKSDTFNHRMLKPEGKDKIRNVTGTRQTMNWPSSQRVMSSCCTVLLNSQMCDSKERKTYIISFTTELPEGLNVEPGALVPGRVQRNPHGILLKQSRKTLVHRQILITLNVQQLRQKNQGVSIKSKNT